MLKVIVTAILRCFDNNALEELYLVNLLHFKKSDVELWKGMEAKWETALRQALPKIWTNTKNYSKMSSPAGINSFNIVRDLQWNNMEKEIEHTEQRFQVLGSKDKKERLFM